MMMRKFFDPPKENVVTFYLFARTSPWKSMCRAELSWAVLKTNVKILVFFWLCCIQSIIGYEVFVHGQRLESSPLVIFHIPFYLVHVKEEFKTFVIAYLCKLHVQARADLWNLHNDELKTYLKSDYSFYT